MCRQAEEGWPTVGLPRHRHFVGFFKVSVQHRHWAILSVLPRLDPSITEWDSNSQPKDDPYVVSLHRGNVQIHCAKWMEPKPHFSCLLRCALGYGGPIRLNPWIPTWYDDLNALEMMLQTCCNIANSFLILSNMIKKDTILKVHVRWGQTWYHMTKSTKWKTWNIFFDKSVLSNILSDILPCCTCVVLEVVTGVVFPGLVWVVLKEKNEPVL